MAFSSFVEHLDPCALGAPAMASSSCDDDSKAILYMFHHVFLPPKLPQKDDFKESHDSTLVATLYDALRELRSYFPESLRLQAAIDMTRDVMRCRSGACLDSKKLMDTLHDLEDGGYVAIQLRAQNTGLLIHQRGEIVVFELFELLANNEAVVSCQGRLIRNFPQVCVHVDRASFINSDFIKALVDMLAKMDRETHPSCISKTKKRGVRNEEERETVNPRLMGMISGILRGNGKQGVLQQICKHSREEVLWDTDKNCFHRSATWLFLRVSLQLVLDRKSAEECLYKPAMAFFMARLLAKAFALPKSLPSPETPPRDSLRSSSVYCMVVKIEQRLRKLAINKTVNDSIRGVVHHIAHVLQEANDHVQRVWQDIQQRASGTLDLESLKSLQFSKDTNISLRKLDPYLHARAKARANPSPDALRAGCHEHFGFVAFDPAQLPNPVFLENGDALLSELASFEDWIAANLGIWLKKNCGQLGVCGRLSSLARAYYDVAQSAYKDNPLNLSLSWLTVMELWVACDELLLACYPLLRDHPVGVPRGFLDALLLPNKQHLSRLAKVEAYLDARESHANPSFPSALDGFGSKHALAIRFFENPNMIQGKLTALHVDIIKHARQEKASKIQEFQSKKAQHDTLQKKYQDISHKKVRNRNGIEQCATRCAKCSLNSDIQGLQIKVHEWPLPEHDLEAKAVVFELLVPKDLSAWRDFSLSILMDWSIPDDPKSRPNGLLYHARQHDALRKHSTGSHQLLELCSTTKPFVVSHYHSLHISKATESTICKPHGCEYQYYNTTAKEVVSAFWGKSAIPASCSFASLSNFPLPGFIGGFSHTSNQVLAAQSRCSKDMGLDAFKAFGHVRSGIQLQYWNILTQLSMPSLDLNNTETALLILQAIYQAGPPVAKGGAEYANIYREAHGPLNDEELGLALINGLRAAQGRIQENWKCDVALFTFVSICCRLLSLSDSDAVHQGCLDFLAEARSIASRWFRDLTKRREKIDSESDRDATALHIFNIGLVCHGTFDVGPKFHDGLFSGDAKVAACFFETCMLVHTFTPARLIGVSPIMRVAYQAFRRLCYDLSPCTLALQTALSEAVSTFLSAFSRGNSWRSTEATLVLESTSSSMGKEKKLLVSYNLLNGSLLVNRRPLSRLPLEIQNHETYTRLLGSRVLEVVPSELGDMEYRAIQQFEGWTLHFAMSDDGVIIRSCNESSTWELIPSSKFGNDIPQTFIEPYFHWQNIQTGHIQFRPHSRQWCTHGQNIWTLKKEGSQTVVTHEAHKFLVNARSETGKKLHGIFLPFEEARYINLIFDSDTEQLEIGLPCFELSFTLKGQSSRIWSKHYPGLCISNDQGIGTLVGLRNRLVLRPEDPARNNKQDVVLIPDGTVSTHHWCPDHPATGIIPIVEKPIVMEIPRRRHHCYRVDPLLGRLADNGSLKSKIMLAHLHARTSHFLPDRLTGRTGRETALSILRSAAVRSFERLGKEDVNRLIRIAELSPVRNFYPAHEQVMQRIFWHSSDLDPLVQSDDYLFAVEAILDFGQESEVFFPESAKTIERPRFSNKKLMRRALIRDSTWYVDGYGAEHFVKAYDTKYQSRYGAEVARLEQAACQIASLLNSQESRLLESVSESCLDKILATIGSEIKAARPEQGDVHLGYDSRWLDSPSISISSRWGTIQRDLCRADMGQKKWDLMTFFGALAFAEEADIQLIQCLLQLALSQRARDLSHLANFLCDCKPLKLGDGYGYNGGQIRKLMGASQKDFSDCPQSRLPAQDGENNMELQWRRQRLWDTKVDRLKDSFEANVKAQWPFPLTVDPPIKDMSVYFDAPRVMKEVRELFDSWHRNLGFRNNLKAIIDTMKGLALCQPVKSVDSSLVEKCSLPSTTGKGYVSIGGMFTCKAPSFFCPSPGPQRYLDKRVKGISEAREKSSGQASSNADMRALLDILRNRAITPYEKEYVEKLEQSLGKCHLAQAPGRIGEAQIDAYGLEKHLEGCSQIVSIIQDEICRSLLSADTAILPSSSHGPRLTTACLLERLNRHHWSNLSVDWKKCIVEWALALTRLQKAQRMVAAAGRPIDLAKELLNAGHSWDPHEFPESLLLEVESGLMIRDAQEKIAAPMRSSAANSVMQLNMGEGKSSVIVQIVAAHLADGDRLVRIIVAKPQSKQMRHMLIDKLGELLDRRVFSMPFSRAMVMDSDKIQGLQKMLEECRKSGGVLLVQPEHLNSFKLMGLEYTGPGPADDQKRPLGRNLLSVQRFMDRHSRDIVDESDENFNVKSELIYTVGLQCPVEMSSDRWIVIQDVMSLVAQYAPMVDKKFPEGLELKFQDEGRFPVVRILKSKAGDDLIHQVARHVCKKGAHNLPLTHQTPSVRDAVLDYIVAAEPRTENVALVEATNGSSFFCNKTTQGTLLLLRGLLAGKVLAFALGQKRYRVNYGLAPARKPAISVAVPFRAKDSPSPRSEFSHPDMVIILTCLSYYYNGLSDEQMFAAIEQLERSDQKFMVYGEWVDNSPRLPPSFRQLGGVNLQDRHQCVTSVFPALRNTKCVVDFFLSTLVFPKEMMEFPKKLSASGWDLARSKPYPVTGFSGTCDSNYVLPLGVKHLDLPELLHTNAMVLRTLLRPENHVVILAALLGSDDILAAVVSSDMPTDVLLDVGALIIDKTNKQVAESWLARRSDKQAVIFCTEDDDIVVVNREGTTEPFTTSPFASQADECLVFLDDSHTRGIDLKLPRNYRAAVTLGPKLTKDRLVQACMRMRELGKGQSVTFLVPPEIQVKIRALSTLQQVHDITIDHILCWAISETWEDSQKSIPLWAVQGIRHQRQEVIWNDVIQGEEQNASTMGDLSAYFEPEAMTLKQRYSPNHRTAADVFREHLDGTDLASRRDHLELIRKRCEHFRITSFATSTLKEEQERELAPETEQERQVEKPALATPWKHSTHAAVRRLVNTGILELQSGAFKPAFDAFKNTSAARLCALSQFGNDILVTADFSRTVVVAPGSVSDAFLRPVQWILTTKSATSAAGALVVISPWEANELMPAIKKSQHVHLHTYAPRTNLSLPNVQDLRLFATPPLPPPGQWAAPEQLLMQLNLFAGQLYFDSRAEYEALCAFLGLSFVPNSGAGSVHMDGFVGRGGAKSGDERYEACRFSASPTPFLKAVLGSIRREGQDISRTHVGRMLSGGILTDQDFAAKEGGSLGA